MISSSANINRKPPFVPSRVAWAVLLFCHVASGQGAPVERGPSWCATHDRWSEKQIVGATGLLGECTLLGVCDEPATRDTHIPGSVTPIKTVRLRFVVFAYDDGSAPAASVQDVACQVATMNDRFLPYRIQFVYTMATVNDSEYRELDGTEETAMKAAYASQPATRCNVFVTQVNAGYLGLATFPWDQSALTDQGGIIVNRTAFGEEQETLVHEVGHVLGLWHTHHGVTETDECSACYEQANGANGDTTGDFCSETPATPVNFACSPPDGMDLCSDTKWGPTQPENYMGYAPDECVNLFVPQQAGRMHCWTSTHLPTWLSGRPEVWVEFAYLGCETGAINAPYNTLAEAVAVVDAGGIIQIKAGSSGEHITIDQPVALHAVGGPVTIGE